MMLKRSTKQRKRGAKLAGPALVVELNLPWIRVLRAERQGDAITALNSAAATTQLSESARQDPVAIGAAIKELLQSSKIKSAPVLMAVPRNQLVLRTLMLPPMQDEADLATLIHFQVGRDLPFRLDEAVVDFKVLERGNQNEEGETAKTEVIVGAVRREIVNHYTAIVQAAGLKLHGLGIQPYGHARCLAADASTSSEQAVALASISDVEVTVDVIARGDVLFSRNAALNSQPLTDGDASPDKSADIEAAAIEVVRSLHSYGGSEGASPVSHVYVHGPAETEAALTKAIGARLRVPCSRFQLGTFFNSAGESSRVSPASVGLVLAATDNDGLPFDFLNPKNPAPPRNTKRTAIIAIAAALTLLLVSTIGARVYLMRGREAVQRDLTAQLALLEKDRPTYRKMIQQAQVIENWNASGKDWLAHYAHLSSVLPPSEEMYISSFVVGANGSIRLAVQAKSGEILAKTEKQLRAAGYEVKPVAVTPASDRFGYDFRSNVEMVPGKALKIDLAKVKAPPRPPDDASLDAAVYKKGSR